MTEFKLNATAASLLGFLHEGPMTGWDLVVTAQERIGDFWSLSQSQVYRELTAMAGAGLIEAGERGPRDRRPFTITDVGRATFAEWLNRDTGEETIRFPLLLIVLFGRHVPSQRLSEVITQHRQRHAERLAGYEKSLTDMAAAPADPYTAATLRFGVRYEQAVLDWFDELPRLIRSA
jgi:DNA-binding PadR family transcriptional regulator